MNYKLSDNAASIAAKIAASRAQYAEMYKPKQWVELACHYDPLNSNILSAIIDQENTLTKSARLNNVCATECLFDPKLNTNSWSYDHANNKLYFSRDLWERKDKEESHYQFHGALASVLANIIFNETTRGFYWRLCFYALGFNPLRDLEERKAIEAIASEKLSQGELPTLKTNQGPMKLTVKDKTK